MDVVRRILVLVCVMATLWLPLRPSYMPERVGAPETDGSARTGQPVHVLEPASQAMTVKAGSWNARPVLDALAPRFSSVAADNRESPAASQVRSRLSIPSPRRSLPLLL